MLAIILMIKQILIFLTQKIVFGKRVEKSKARPLEWSANSSIKKNVERVSKVLKSSKHHNIWIQMKEHLNIQYLLFKYLVFFPFLCFILAIRYFKIKHVNLSFIFSFFFFAECDTSIIHNIPKYKISLVNARERFLFY